MLNNWEKLMAYVDGFVTPVPKRKLEAYRRMSRKAGKVMGKVYQLDAFTGLTGAPAGAIASCALGR